jgi:hypothetical protein
MMIEKKSKEILEGHIRIGKKFLPPIARLKNIQELSYVNQLLPEIIWMGLINENLEHKKSIELALSLATTAKENYKSERFINFALCSSFDIFEGEEKHKIVELLGKKTNLTDLRTYLAPLIVLYEGCPLRFLGTNEDIVEKDELINQIKKCVGNHLDKFSAPALAIQAEVAYIRGMTGGLYFPQGVEPPDLNAMLNEPHSEKAEKAAAFVRAFVLSEVQKESDDEKFYWPREFWNQGIKIDKCEIKDRNNE